MPNGKVKFFNANKGFGFITADEDGKELFVPAASLVSAGISGLKAGQRVSFETKPDSKGPKAVNITLLANPPPPQVAAKTVIPAVIGDSKASMIFYHDPGNDESCNALDRLRAAGWEPHVIEYLTTPPAREVLKNLAVLLRGSDQSLVRKYDPLFLELCLDDRFISENEFWGAIFEHPSLINGPIVATETKASLCRSEKDIDTFLARISSDWVQPAQKRKRLPEGILRLIRGESAPPPAEEAKPIEVAEKKKPVEAAGRATNITKTTAVEPKPKKVVKAEKKPKLALKPKSKNKPKAGAAKTQKPATRKPAGKVRRAKRK